MKVATGAVLLALSGAAFAMPLPAGVLDNVQDSCTGMGAGCVPAGPFLHHLADSETKYLHLVHPDGSVSHVSTSSGSLGAPPSSSSSSSSLSFGSSAASAADHDEETSSGKPAAGEYPSSNHPATSTPFTEPPTSSSLNSTSAAGPSSKSASLTADSSTTKPQDDDQLDKSAPVKPAGTAVAPNSTVADKLLTKGTLAPLPGASPSANETSTLPESPATNSTSATSPAAAAAGPADDAAKKPLDANSTNVADATGIAQAPNLLKSNDVSQDHKDGAMGVHSNVLMPLCSMVLAAAGAIFLL